jgi:dinuclear metal center YbgI/SA1388 family protein
VVKVQDLLDNIENIAGPNLAERSDNVGLLIGSPELRVSRVLLALDPTCAVLEQAEHLGAELIITHHPVIFHPLKTLRTDQPQGDFIQRALRAGISVIGCHTNFDAVRGGVSDVLAHLLGLEQVKPLVENQECQGCGLGRVGTLPAPMDPAAFIRLLHTSLEPPWLLEGGPRPEQVTRVAVCGGSCSDFARTALHAGADVFLTAEVKHDVARWAEEAGLWLLDGGHFATENPAVQALEKLLVNKIRHAGLEVIVRCADQGPPLRLAT